MIGVWQLILTFFLSLRLSRGMLGYAGEGLFKIHRKQCKLVSLYFTSATSVRAPNQAHNPLRTTAPSHVFR